MCVCVCVHVEYRFYTLRHKRVFAWGGVLASKHVIGNDITLRSDRKITVEQLLFADEF